MANEQNLKNGKNGHQLTTEEAQKGGIASGKARRRKKTMQQLAQMIATAQVTNEDARDALSSLGLSDEDMQNSALPIFGIFRAACEGNVQAFAKWQELIEPPAQDQTHESKITIVMDDSVKNLGE